jgi:hypothetical protein
MVLLEHACKVDHVVIVKDICAFCFCSLQRIPVRLIARQIVPFVTPSASAVSASGIMRRMIAPGDSPHVSL